MHNQFSRFKTLKQLNKRWFEDWVRPKKEKKKPTQKNPNHQNRQQQELSIYPPETWCDSGSYNTLLFWKLSKATSEMNLLEFLTCAAILHRFYICFQIITTDAAKASDWNVPWYSRQKRFAWVVRTNLSDFHILQTYLCHSSEPSVLSGKLFSCSDDITCIRCHLLFQNAKEAYFFEM